MDSKRLRLKALLTNIRKILNGPPPTVCEQLRSWAETTKLCEIITVHSEDLKLRRKLPSTQNTQTPIEFTENVDYTIYDRALYRITNATIHGKDGWITLPDGKMTWQTAWSQSQLTSCEDYWKRRKIPIQHKHGNWFTLILYWGLGYYHWFNDVLCLLYQNIDKLPEDTKYIIPADAARHHIDSLMMIGISEDKLVRFDGNERWRLENLWFAPPASQTGHQVPGALQWIKEAADKFAPHARTTSNPNLYVSRKLAKSRSVTNEDELLPVLQKHNFRILHTEKMRFEEQISAFQSAKCVCAPHGAGLTNLIFAPKGTKVLEIFEPTEVRICYWAMCCELEHDYNFLMGKTGAKRGVEPDIVVNKNELDLALAQIMS